MWALGWGNIRKETFCKCTCQRSLKNIRRYGRRMWKNTRRSYVDASVIRNSFKTFPGVAGIIWKKLLLWVRKCTLTFFVALRMRSEGNAQKDGINSSFHLHDNAPAHRSVLVKDFFNKEQCDNIRANPRTLLSWFQLIFTYLDWNQRRRVGAFLMLQTSLRMWRNSWKEFHQMAFRNVSDSFTDAGRSEWLHKGLF
jgi:hypothetical protein